MVRDSIQLPLAWSWTSWTHTASAPNSDGSFPNPGSGLVSWQHPTLRNPETYKKNNLLPSFNQGKAGGVQKELFLGNNSKIYTAA